MKLEQYFVNAESHQLNNTNKSCKPRGKVYDRMFALSRVSEFNRYVDEFHRYLYAGKRDDRVDALKYTFKLFGVDNFKD